MGAARLALDVGCGRLHWGLRLLPYLAPDALLVGVEPAPSLRRGAMARSEAAGLAARVRVVSGAAEALPFADGAFDLVTCQTVLMHVPDAERALFEMIRVLRPGGLLWVTEPDNVATAVAGWGGDPEEPVEVVTARLRLTLTLARGRRALGQGDEAVGARLPGLLSGLGLVEVDTCINERCVPQVSPYDDPLGTADLKRLAEGHAGSERPSAQEREQFAAGGGDPAELDALWCADREARQRALDAAGAGRLSRAGAVVQVVATGRKPVGWAGRRV